MNWILFLIFLGVCFLFLRASLVTFGFYKEPVLSAFQQYGDEVRFSPLLDMLLWGFVLVFFLFMAIVPSAILVMFGIVFFTILFLTYWRVKENVMEYPEVFLQYPRWYRDIVEHTSREERRKISYMWLGLPFRTRLLYNAREDAFRKWVELVVISVA